MRYGSLESALIYLIGENIFRQSWPWRNPIFMPPVRTNSCRQIHKNRGYCTYLECLVALVTRSRRDRPLEGIRKEFFFNYIFFRLKDPFGRPLITRRMQNVSYKPLINLIRMANTSADTFFSIAGNIPVPRYSNLESSPGRVSPN